jgi:O-antigen/teichoic acid export membrane protein
MKTKILLKSGGSIAVKVAQALFGLVTAFVLGRFFGAETFGIYAYAVATATLIAVFTRFGFHTYVVYAVGRAIADDNRKVIFTIVVTSLGAAFVFSGVVGGIVYAMSFLRPTWEMSEAMGYAAVLIGAVALMQICGGIFQSFGRVTLGISLEAIGKPVLFLMILGGAALIKGLEAITYPDLLVYYILSEVVVILYAFVMLYKWTKSEMGGFHFDASLVVSIIHEARPFLMANAMIQLYQQAGIIAVGLWFAPAQVGYYRIATQVAALIVFGLQALQSVMQPQIARLKRGGDIKGLQHDLTWTIRVLAAVQSPFMIALIVCPSFVVSVFGADFVAAAPMLAVLAVGQSFSVLCGLNGPALNMSGFASVNAKISIWALMLVVLLLWPMTQIFGVLGAAIAVGISRVFWNVCLVYAAASYAGLHTTILGILPIRLKHTGGL